MAGVYEALARGLETGYNLGRQRDLDAEQRRQTAVREQRQAAEDERTAKAETRAGLDLALREQREARQESRSEEQMQRQRMLDAGTLLGGRQKQIVEESTARQRAGMPVDETAAAEYGQNQAALAKIRQEALNFFSRTQTGQADPMSVPPGELYMNLTAATGMLPEEIAKMPAHIKDIEAGQQTGNRGLTIKGVNGLLASQLRRGVGGPDPHGGTIVEKGVIDLDPDPNNPQYMIPRLRVYVDHPSMPGPRLENGATGYYDAPMTKNGSTDPNDPVVGINMKRGFDYMGNMGVLAEAVQRPDVAARLAQGAKEAGPAAQKYIDDLTALSRPTKKTVTREKVDLGDRVLEREVDETGKVIKESSLKKGAPPRMFAPGAGAGLAAALKAAEGLTGDELLASLPDGTANLIRALDEGRMSVKDLSTKGGHREQMMTLWSQYNPGANARDFATGQQTENAFAKGKQGDTVRSFNVAIEHLDTLESLVKALENGDIPAINKLRNEYLKQTGDAAPTNLAAAVQIVTNEVTKATVGSQNALGDRQEIARQVNRDASQGQLAGSIKTYRDLMTGQLKGLGTQYYAGGGLKDFSRYLTPRTRELVGEVARPPSRATGGGAGKQPASFADEAAAAAAAKAGKIKVGDRITINGQSGTWQ